MNAPGLNFKAERPLHAPREAKAGPLIGPQPLIRTGRLTLRRPRASDAPAIAASLSNFNVGRMLLRVPQPYHLEDAEDWLALVERSGESGWAFAVTLGGVRAMMEQQGARAANSNRDDTLVGVVSVAWLTAAGRDGWHMGYWLDEAHWGKGITTEAVNAVVARFFSAHMGEVLYSSVMADNPASLRIQAKLGFDVTGTAEAFSMPRAEMARLITTELTFGGYMPL